MATARLSLVGFSIQEMASAPEEMPAGLFHANHRVKTATCCLRPGLHEVAKVWKKIACSVDEHNSKEIFGSGPYNTKSESTYCEDDDAVGNCVEGAWVCAEAFQFASMAKEKTGRVRQA